MQYVLGLSQRNQEEYWVRSLVEDHLPVIYEAKPTTTTVTH